MNFVGTGSSLGTRLPCKHDALARYLSLIPHLFDVSQENIRRIIRTAVTVSKSGATNSLTSDIYLTDSAAEL